MSTMADKHPAVARHSGETGALGMYTVSRPSVSIGDWFQDPLNTKILDTQVPSIKWHSTFGPLYLGAPNPPRDPKLVESADLDPLDTEGRLYDLPVGDSGQFTNELAHFKCPP